MQVPIVEAYLAALPAGVTPRILASRTAVVVDAENLDATWSAAEPGVRRLMRTFLRRNADGDLRDLARQTDTHLGTVEQVTASLTADETLALATDVAFQVHSVDPAHEITLRSIELLATEVAPRVGLRTGAEAAEELRPWVRRHSPPLTASCVMAGAQRCGGRPERRPPARSIEDARSADHGVGAAVDEHHLTRDVGVGASESQASTSAIASGRAGPASGIGTTCMSASRPSAVASKARSWASG